MDSYLLLSMHRWRSAIRAAALLELLAATAGTRVIATDFRATANDLCDFLLRTKMIFADQFRRLAATLVTPIGMDSHQRRFDFLHPLLGTSILAGDLDALFGAQPQEWREPCGLSDG